MLAVADVRRLALSLEGSVEQDHHGFPSFRVAGKIFATLPDDEHLHVMLPEDRIREIVAADPHASEEKWWGKKLAAVRVSLPDAAKDRVAEMLEEAWSMRRPAAPSSSTSASRATSARRAPRAAGKRSKRGGP
jgi:hypothetical protein